MPKKIPPHVKEKAIQLRLEKQMTVPDIAEQLEVARSTVHGWLKDYPLKERTEKQKNAQYNASMANKALHKKKRETAYDRGWDEAPELFKDLFFRDFVNMYLAEGYKKTRHEVSISNSDPAVIVMARHYMLKYANPENTLTYEVQIHDDQNPVQIQAYWSNWIGVSPEEIIILQKSNSGNLSGRKSQSLSGVLTIRIGDTYFRQRLEAWMNYRRTFWLDRFVEQT